MSTYQSNPIRFVMSVMAFVLIVTVLPVRPSTAQVFGRDFTKQEVDQAVWKAAARKARRTASKSSQAYLKDMENKFSIIVSEEMLKVRILGTPKAQAFTKLFAEYDNALQRDSKDNIGNPKIKSVGDLTRMFFDVASRYPELETPVVQLFLRLSRAETYEVGVGVGSGQILAPSVKDYGLARLIVNQHDAAMGRVFQEGQVSEGLSLHRKMLLRPSSSPLSRTGLRPLWVRFNRTCTGTC